VKIVKTVEISQKLKCTVKFKTVQIKIIGVKVVT